MHHMIKKDRWLALFDYVSRAHEIEICPSSVVHLLSVCVTIISEHNAWISFKFWLLLLLGHTLNHFVILEKKIDFLMIFFHFY